MGKWFAISERGSAPSSLISRHLTSRLPPPPLFISGTHLLQVRSKKKKGGGGDEVLHAQEKGARTPGQCAVSKYRAWLGIN